MWRELRFLHKKYFFIVEKEAFLSSCQLHIVPREKSDEQLLQEMRKNGWNANSRWIRESYQDWIYQQEEDIGEEYLELQKRKRALDECIDKNGYKK